MTIPYQHNCTHSEDGWCLRCVRELAEAKADSSATPFTDKHQQRLGDSDHFVVHVVHVRQLERELAEAKANGIRWREIAEELANHLREYVRFSPDLSARETLTKFDEMKKGRNHE